MFRRLLAVLVLGAACATPNAPPERNPVLDTVPQGALLAPKDRSPIASSAGQLAQVCWPRPYVPTQSVTLNFKVGAGGVEDVEFQAGEGTPNSVARCIRQVTWLYPWREAPYSLTLKPPEQPPSGWVALEYVTVLAERTYPPARGVLSPGRLARACTARGFGLRPTVRFKVQPLPLQVTVTDTSGTPGADRAISDSERCVEALLAATAYADSRPLELDLHDPSGAPDPAPPEAVAAYFAPKDAPPPTGSLDASSAQLGIAGLRQQVAGCWNAALNRRSGLAGGRTFRIRVEENGSVGFAHVIGDRSSGGEGEAVDYVLDRCLLAAIQTAHFAPPTGGPADFTYAWVFARR